ncbi:MAG: hypothetical protein O7E56_06345 [SAR324 cluster bacterium]|nr:hypothetical protein [SAR324 cluster bacterium]
MEIEGKLKVCHGVHSERPRGPWRNFTPTQQSAVLSVGWDTAGVDQKLPQKTANTYLCIMKYFDKYIRSLGESRTPTDELQLSGGPMTLEDLEILEIALELYKREEPLDGKCNALIGLLLRVIRLDISIIKEDPGPTPELP